MMLCHELNTQIHTWIRDYDRIQSLAVILIYIQIGCALIGSLGALYNGVSLVNLGIALFALVAIESGNQSLGRTYAVLLFSALLLDILWFILFSYEIWHISLAVHGKFAVYSVKLTLLMQLFGFSVRLSSSLLWIQMYRLGMSLVDGTFPQDGDLESRNSFINPATPPLVRHTPDVLGGAICDPGFYSSLSPENQDEGSLHSNRCSSAGGSMTDAPLFKPSFSRSSQAIHERIAGSTLGSL